MTLILGLDQSGVPHRWVNLEEAACYYAKNSVAWEAGNTFITLRGGINTKTGKTSILSINSIIAVHGDDYYSKNYEANIPLTRKALFRRDLCICGYCSRKFNENELELEHVIPKSKGGKTSWTNIVSACRYCNSRKGDKTPKQAGMDLVYVPYAPNRHEAFILSNRNILADQMDFLAKGLPKHSRLLPL